MLLEMSEVERGIYDSIGTQPILAVFCVRRLSSSSRLAADLRVVSLLSRADPELADNQLRLRQLCCHLQISETDANLFGDKQRTLAEIRVRFPLLLLLLQWLIVLNAGVLAFSASAGDHDCAEAEGAAQCAMLPWLGAIHTALLTLHPSLVSLTQARTELELSARRLKLMRKKNDQVCLISLASTLA